MVERVKNVMKQDSKKAKRSLQLTDEDVDIPKKRRKGVDLLRHYPVNSDSILESENVETMEQHNNAISTELKPRDGILLPLFKYTYGERRMFVLNEAESVSHILEKHPGFSRQAIVSY